MTLKQLRAGMDSHELPLWMAYRRRWGFPSDRIMHAVAISGAHTCQAFGKSIRPQDNLPVYDQADDGLTPEATKAALDAWARATNAARG